MAREPIDTGRAQALRLLQVRDRTRTEIAHALARRGHSPEVIATLLAEFEAARLVDDTRFAAGRARSLAARGFGPRRVWLDLHKRGIPKDVAEVALQEALDEAPSPERMRALVGKRFGPTALSDADREASAKIGRYLIGRGFPPQEVQELLRTYKSNTLGF